MKLPKWTYMVLILIGAASYGLLSSTIKLAYEAGYGDAEVTNAQAWVGTLMMWLLVLVTPGARGNPFKGSWLKLSFVGIFGIAATTIFINMTLTELDASLSIVLLFQFTWITILMECIAKRVLPTKVQLFAIAIVMGGTLLAVNLFGADWQSISTKGLVLGICSAFSYSLFLFMAGRVQTGHHPLMKSAIMMTAGLIPIVIVYPPVFLGGTGMSELLLWGVLFGLIGQVIPTICFLIGIPRTGAAMAAIFGAMELPVALIAAFFILKESVLGVQWLGMLLILAGVVVSERMQQID